MWKFLAGAATAMAGATVAIGAWHAGIYLRWRASLQADEDDEKDWKQEVVALLVFIAHSPIPMASPMIVERAKGLIPDEVKIITHHARELSADELSGTKH